MGARWVPAEGLPQLKAVYTETVTEPILQAPASARNRHWERAEAVRELVRGRIEISGPVTVADLSALFALSTAEIEGALLALEAEGFILRGRFRPGAAELEWCDRWLLARIHRLTINRLRAEIQPVSIADFQRFLLAWQRVDPDHQAEGPEGLEAVLELLDGYQLPAGAWEPEVLALRVKQDQPEWLDRLCFRGRVGWGRLSPPQNQKSRLFGPIRSSPISLFSRENLGFWLQLSPPGAPEFSPDTARVLETLTHGGALFFGELMAKVRSCCHLGSRKRWPNWRPG